VATVLVDFVLVLAIAVDPTDEVVLPAPVAVVAVVVVAGVAVNRLPEPSKVSV
jgi:hypothetical protein